MASKSWVRRLLRGLGASVLAGWALAGLGALGGCEDEETAPGDTAAICSELTTRLRSCELLSEGEVDCRIFERGGYGACVIECVRAASCDEIRAQTCDDADNPYSRCKGNCEFQAFGRFNCGDGQFVDIDYRCDDDPDCSNGADERDCDAPEATFDCGDGGRVGLDEQCDGISACSNGRDEEGCPQRAETLCPGGF
jgi:hypothetical protein